MVIRKYDISLIRLKREHIEELRYWRNSPEIRETMEYREYITKEMQEKWFETVNDIRQHAYFIIHINGKNIGLINGKNTTSDECEAGMFIWDKSFLNTHYPVAVSLIMSDVHYYAMKNNRSNCKILRTNKQAIAFNKLFGYQLLPGQENVLNQKYTVTKEAYEKHSVLLRKSIRNIYPQSEEVIIIQLEPEDYTNGVAEFVISQYEAIDKENTPVAFRLIR